VFHSEHLDGPFTPTTDPIASPELGPMYAGRLVPNEAGAWQFLAFRGAGDRDFVGELTDPLPVRFDATGAIQTLAATPSPVG
jgi:beta-fructofuranosidase